jgi:uncharacterized protein YutE (UPF0331/DUF86 family)
MDDVLVYKAQTIERCIKRVQQEYVGFENTINTNFTKQDAIVLNIERACQACIDMGNHYIKTYKLGIPQSNKDVFQVLYANNIINNELNKKLQAMVGFQNIAVHDYSILDLDILHSIVKNELDDLLAFSKLILTK